MVTTAIEAMLRMLLMFEKNLQTAPFSPMASCAQADAGNSANMATNAAFRTSDHAAPALSTRLFCFMESFIAGPSVGWCGKRRTPYTPWLARSDEHTSELQSLLRISYAVFCLHTQNTFIV